jgi:hypothetical protein
MNDSASSVDYPEENLGLLNIPKGMLAKEESRELISLISKGKENIFEQNCFFKLNLIVN